VLALMGVSFLWFMVLSLRTGIHPLAFLHTFPYTTFRKTINLTGWTALKPWSKMSFINWECKPTT